MHRVYTRAAPAAIIAYKSNHNDQHRRYRSVRSTEYSVKIFKPPRDDCAIHVAQSPPKREIVYLVAWKKRVHLQNATAHCTILANVIRRLHRSHRAVSIEDINKSEYLESKKNDRDVLHISRIRILKIDILFNTCHLSWHYTIFNVTW